MNTSLSIFARALASENLSFSFDSEAQTASFDVKNRHLVMPVWNVSETVQTMLVAHEISHALWTPYERSEELLKQAEADGYIPEVLQRIANIVEDVRIEKLMKDKYPGTRRDFFLGYKEIMDKDMFGFKGADLSKTNLLNRLNIHFKWGVPGFIDLPLSHGEQEIARAIDGVTDFDQVYEVAKALYQHPDVQKMIEEYKQATEDNGEGNKQGEGMLDKMLPDSDSFAKKNGEEYNAGTLIITGVKNISEYVIPTATLRDAFMRDSSQYHHQADSILTAYRQFVRESDAFVRQLVAQFERRKAADEIRRERPKQTGMLNLDRLHQYRTHDDIFLSKIIKQDGKNHGIVFLLDFSGSMSHQLKDCFLQVLQLVWFCEKAKIPFEVFSFTEQHPHTLHRFGIIPNVMHRPDQRRECLNSMAYQNTRLLTLASSRDSAEDRERLLSMLYGMLVMQEISRPAIMHLGGTPTVEAVSLASQFMQDWVRANNIQIPTLMVVTDGNPNGIDVKTKQDDLSHYYYGSLDTITIMDEVTGTGTVLYPKKATVDFPNLILSALLDGLKQTLNARCVGMFVGPRSLGERDFLQFCVSNDELDAIYSNRSGHVDISKSPRYQAAKEAYADGAIIVHPNRFPGYDSFFLVKTPKIVKDEDAVVEAGTFTKIKNTFIKTMGRRATSRVFLTRYIDIVAGQPVKGHLDKIYNHPAK